MKRLVKEYAQHFLRSPRLVRELIGHSTIRRGDVVLDLGAGSGVITEALAERCKEVWAVEAEPRTVALLRTNMRDHANVCVIEAPIEDVALPEVPYKVFANIPFGLSSQIVRRLTSAANPPRAIYLIVQRQFAQKLLPERFGFTGQLGMMIGPWWQVRIRRPLKRTDYMPPPNVDTVLLELKQRETPLIVDTERENYREWIAACFADPRVFAKTPRVAAGISPELRPSQLMLAQWVKLYTIDT